VPKPPEANLLARLYFHGVERGDADVVATGVRRVTGHDVPEMGHPIDALCIEIQEPQGDPKVTVVLHEPHDELRWLADDAEAKWLYQAVSYISIIAFISNKDRLWVCRLPP